MALLNDQRNIAVQIDLFQHYLLTFMTNFLLSLYAEGHASHKDDDGFGNHLQTVPVKVFIFCILIIFDYHSTYLYSLFTNVLVLLI